MTRSWLDALTGLVDRVPAPRWAVYLAVGAAWVILGSIATWIADRGTFSNVGPMLAIGIGLPLIALWWMQALDAVARRALASLRPQLDLNDQETAAVASDLSRTPPAWAAVALVAGTVAGLGSILGNPSSWGLDEGASSIDWALRLLTSVAASIVVFGFLAHVVHQLRLVDRLHRHHVRVDLFRLEPVYAFATLTARTGMTLIGLAVVGFAAVSTIVPGLRLSVADISSAVVLFSVAIACFVAPLLSLHHRIVEEKDRRLAEANGTLAATLAELRRRVTAGEIDDAARLNDAVAAANSSVLVVARVSTWPWRPETLRAFAGAVLLPIGLWIVFELLRRVLPA
ncbi:MAG TPA: hypothetical protein VFV53_08045 [Candidatus Limnocylindrales bacterium]|nr:hypothetical protein [Candidatus Limnocylindrales bacterium]